MRTHPEILTIPMDATSLLPYDQAFFDGHEPGAARSANAVVPLIVDAIRPSSVLDVGCGKGVWLREFLRRGVSNVLGVDGEYVDQNKLAIPKDFFRAKNLANGIVEFGRFDLVTCLEVAEHLPENASSALVQSLVQSSEFVLFSAAIPGQRGQNHINEQWPEFWQALFSRHRYEHPEWDSLRLPGGQSPIEWMHFDVARREETFHSVWKKFRRVVGLSLANHWPRLFRFIVALKGEGERRDEQELDD